MGDGHNPLVLFSNNGGTALYFKGRQLSYDVNSELDLSSEREAFNQAIAGMSTSRDDLAWNQLRLAERNTLVHSLFAELCLLSLVLKRESGVDVVQTDSWFVYYALVGRGWRTDILSRLGSALDYGKRLAGAVRGTFRFVLSQWIMLRHYRRIRALDSPPEIDDLLVSWTGRDGLSQKNYREQYFGDLASYLEKAGRTTLTLVLPYQLNDRMLATLRRSDNSILLLQDLMETLDCLRILRLEWQKHIRDLKTFEYQGEDFTRLVRRYQQLEHAEISSSMALALPRLKRFSPKRIFHQFENMIPERVLNLVVRQSMPNVECVGYFHTSKPDNLLCLEFLDNEDAELSPRPDRIVFNSDSYRDYYAGKYIKIPCASGYAFKQSSSGCKVKDRKRVLLAALPGVDSECRLLLACLSAAVLDDLPVFVKTHPMNPYPWRQHSGSTRWQAFESLTWEPTHIVSGYSGSLLEYAAQGANVAMVYDPSRPALNPCDGTGFQCDLISKAEDLERFVQTTDSNQPRLFFNLDSDFYKEFLP